MSTEKPNDLTGSQYRVWKVEDIQRIGEVWANLRPAMRTVARAVADAQAQTREEYTLVDGDEETVPPEHTGGNAEALPDRTLRALDQANDNLRVLLAEQRQRTQRAEAAVEEALSWKRSNAGPQAAETAMWRDGYDNAVADIHAAIHGALAAVRVSEPVSDATVRDVTAPQDWTRQETT